MSLLKTVQENEASGIHQQVYDGFKQTLGKVPNVVKFHSSSPITFGRIMDLLNQFAEHPTLDPVLISYLRMIISHRNEGLYCEKFQSFLTKARGESAENIEIAKKDPSQLPMDEKRKALLLFALDLVERKQGNTKERLEQLRNFGWIDEHIFEYCFLAGLQKGMIPLVTGFEVEHDFQ